MDAENTVIATHRDYATEIADIIRSNLAPKLIREKLLDYHENDIAAALAPLSTAIPWPACLNMPMTYMNI